MLDVAHVTDQIRGAVLANRTLEDVRAILNHACKLGWLEKNVALSLRKRREVPRERYLRREEVLVLFDALSNIPSADLIRFLVLTGCRLNEARQLMWSDIQGDISIKRAVTTKARRTHSVPLLPAALLLVGRQKRRGLYAFSRFDGSPIGSVQKVWETARRKAGFPDLAFMTCAIPWRASHSREVCPCLWLERCWATPALQSRIVTPIWRLSTSATGSQKCSQVEMRPYD